MNLQRPISHNAAQRCLMLITSDTALSNLHASVNFLISDNGRTIVLLSQPSRVSVTDNVTARAKRIQVPTERMMRERIRVIRATRR